MKTDINLAATILSGLLASGHYTIAGDDNDCPKLEKVDNGKGCKDMHVYSRFTTLAIEHALDLCDELEEQIELNEKLRQED